MKKTAATILATFYLTLITGVLYCNVDRGLILVYQVLSGKSATIVSADLFSECNNECSEDVICIYASSKEALKPVLKDLDGLKVPSKQEIPSLPDIFHTCNWYICKISPADPSFAFPLYLKNRVLLI
ncbi:hypothetical protein ABDD95_07195 [Mucilaginibacter sp. PAMB04274]|uniref:hypothetical protein n=1 Tax=Mucilaginibacter sp. PAMB04274 TaxID=3138568 RepID=UPI0031F60BB3